MFLVVCGFFNRGVGSVGVWFEDRVIIKIRVVCVNRGGFVVYVMVCLEIICVEVVELFGVCVDVLYFGVNFVG